MQQKFFVKPFAVAGDREAVPNDTQTTGDVSYEQGYGYDYQRDQATNPLAKPIERNRLNAILNNITEAVQQYQVFGTPEWITSEDNGGTPYPYARRSRVRYRAKDADPWDVYESLVDNNTVEPSDTTKWVKVVSVVASQEQAIAGTDNNTVMTPLRVAQAIAASANNVGQIVFEPRTSARAGYLKCNGALLNRADYPALWAYAQAGGALVSDTQWSQQNYQGCFSSGDGTKTFRIPDVRGEFVRCWDDGRGVDSGRAIGSFQGTQNSWHAHSALAAAAGEHSHSAWTDTQGWHGHTVNDPGHAHTLPWCDGSYGNTGSGVPIGGSSTYSSSSGTGIWLSGDGNHTHNVDIGGAGNHSHDITVNGDGGGESRPRNIAWLAMIRY